MNQVLTDLKGRQVPCVDEVDLLVMEFLTINVDDHGLGEGRLLGPLAINDTC